jgi:DNA-binding CsgD family transcriptional regulator
MSLQTVGDDYVGIVRTWGAGLEACCRSSIDRMASSTTSAHHVDDVLSAVDDAVTHGLYVSAAYVLHDLARAGASATAAELIAGLADETDAESVRWMSTHVHALWRRDPTGLLKGARAAAAAGATTLAVQMLDDGRTMCVEQRHAQQAVEFSSALDRLWPNTTGWLVRDHTSPVPSALGLSQREEQVARGAADGLTDAEIATQLFISVRTVNAHLRTVYRKLGIDGRRSLRSVFGPATTNVRSAPR